MGKSGSYWKTRSGCCPAQGLPRPVADFMHERSDSLRNDFCEAGAFGKMSAHSATEVFIRALLTSNAGAGGFATLGGTSRSASLPRDGV